MCARSWMKLTFLKLRTWLSSCITKPAPNASRYGTAGAIWLEPGV